MSSFARLADASKNRLILGKPEILMNLCFYYIVIVSFSSIISHASMRAFTFTNHYKIDR